MAKFFTLVFVTVLVSACTQTAHSQVLINEQFNGTEVDTSIFTFPGTGDESFFGLSLIHS